MFEILFLDFPNFADFPWTRLGLCAIVIFGCAAIVWRASKGE